MSQAASDAQAAYQQAIGQLYALGQELAPLPPLPDGTPAPRRKWDLAHMRTLCAALAQDGVAPQHAFPSVLIAGTNGKGSTAATLAAILAAAGLKTALYTSPHLVRVNERIQILPPQPQQDTALPGAPTDRQNTAIPSAARHQANTVILSGARSAESKDPRISLESPIIPGAPRLASETWDVNSPPDLPSESPTSPGSPEIPDHTFARLFSLVDDTAAALVRSGDLPHPPSFFEVLTALAFLYFAEEKIDIAVLEVGLGGRLDATNIVEPLISVITDIALDHQEYLGDTIAQITREKAGILRPNGILVTLPQHPEANQAIGEAAATLNLHAISAADFIPSQHQHPRPGNLVPAPDPRVPHVSILRHGNEDPRVPHVSILRHGNEDPGVPHVSLLRHGNDTAQPSVFTDPLPRNRYTLTLDNQPLEVDSPLPGHHQQRNLALALATALALRNLSSYKNKTSNQNSYNIPNSAMEAGIRNTRWPGRLEFLPPNLLLDVAHNPAGAWTLRAAIAQLPESQPRTLLFSCLADKDLTEISRILFPLFDSSPEGSRPGTRGPREQDHIVFAPIANPRAAKIEDLLAAARALDIPAHAAPHLEAALAQARAVTPPGGLILATGSVYLVGAIRNLVIEEQRQH